MSVVSARTLRYFPMLLAIQVLTLLLVAVTMATALAHALEFPGKRRLDETAYLDVQTIYYPGFTIAGLAEPVSAIATLVLFYMFRANRVASVLILTAFVALAAMHVIFWIFTQPVNKFWLRRQRLTSLGKRFFSAGAARTGTAHSTSGRSGSIEPDPAESRAENWQRMRDRWEYSHLVRAVLSLIALITLNVALLVYS